MAKTNQPKRYTEQRTVFLTPEQAEVVDALVAENGTNRGVELRALIDDGLVLRQTSGEFNG